MKQESCECCSLCVCVCAHTCADPTMRPEVRGLGWGSPTLRIQAQGLIIHWFFTHRSLFLVPQVLSFQCWGLCFLSCCSLFLLASYQTECPIIIPPFTFYKEVGESSNRHWNCIKHNAAGDLISVCTYYCFLLVHRFVRDRLTGVMLFFKYVWEISAISQC